MAYYYKDGSGIDSSAYIYVQLQVTRTDYPTYSHFSVKSVAVSDTGTSSFIRGQVTTNQAGNSWTAATGWKSVSYNGTTTLATATFDVTRGASDKTAHIGAYAEGGGTSIYAGGTDYAWLDVTVPKVLAPNAPTGCTATYVSDSQATVSWTNGATDSDHPRDATLVERRDGSNDWAQVASASGTASGYTDNGISPNTQYQYRVRAKNVAGYSAYSTSGSIYTTPASPSSVTLDKTAATTVQVDVTGTWGYSVTYDIESTYDGGSTWASVATSTSLPYSATVNAGTVQFRVRAVRGALSSAWTLSASLVTICPPLAPTIVQAPANPTAYGDSSAISWTPNHPDGSAQASAEVKVTNPGGTSTTYTVTTATSYQLTPNATGTWTAQVRTKGLDPSYGEWSQAVSWAVANPPAVVITSPATDGTDINALPMTVSWTVTDSTGVSTQRIIIEGGSEILNRTLAGDVRTLSLTASDVDLIDGETYTIRIRVMGGSGLVTEQTRIFDVAWLAPTPPVLQITEGEGRSATIDVMDTRYTSSGTVLEASSSMMESLTIHGASVQDGTPTPSAPVPIKSVEGRNLLEITASQQNINGTTFTPQDDGSVIVNGTPNPAAYYKCASITLAAGTYAFSGYVDGVLVTTTTHCRIYIHVPSQNISANSGTSFTLTQSAGADVYIQAYVNQAYNAEVFRIQLEHGTAVHPWQPYQHVNLMTVGTNLLGNLVAGDYSAMGITCIVGEDNKITFGGTATGGGNIIIPLEETVPCPVSAYVHLRNDAAVDNESITFQPSLAAFNGPYTGIYDTNRIVQLNNSQGIKTIGSVMFYIQNGQTYNTVHMQPTLELTDAVTEFETYQGTMTPIPVTLRSLPDGTHDEWVSGESADTLVQRVGVVVIDGTTKTAYSIYTGGNPSRKHVLVDMGADSLPSNTNTLHVMCDRLQGLSGDAEHLGADGICNASNRFLRFANADTQAFSTTADANTWLQSNPLTVYYPLATPVTTTLPHVTLPYVDGSAWVDAEVTPNIEATFRPVDFPDQPAADSIDVIRVNADGTTWTVASGLSVGDTAIDPLPPLGVTVEYRAVGTAPSGATSSGSYTETFGGRDWVLNFGNAAQEHVEFIYNPQTDLSLKQGGALYHFADGGAGKGLPVFYPTTDRDCAGTLKFDTILYGDSDKVLDLCDRYPVAWLRDPFGHRWRAHVAPSVSHGVGQIWPVTLSWDAMRFEEAWDG